MRSYGDPQRTREYALAYTARQEGDPWPMLEYQVTYRVQPDYNDDEDQIIREKYRDWGAGRLAILLRRTPNSIRKRAQVLNVKSGLPQGSSQSFRWDHDKHAPIVKRLAAEGATQHEIGAAIGTSATTVGKYMARLGIAPIGRRPRGNSA